jgi:hypothetical protein
MEPYKPIKITYTFNGQPLTPWRDDQLERLLNDMTTDLILTGMDLREVDIADSENKDAIRMLKEIGIEN